MISTFKNNLKQLLRSFRGWNNTLIGVIAFRLLKILCTFTKPNVVLTYSNNKKPDGVGAQLQRLLALRSLCKSLGLGYKHTEIASVAIHPLDSYQTLEQMKEFVSELNHEFFMQDSKFDESLETLEVNVPNLKFREMFIQVLKSNFTKKQIVIQCVEPYSIAECDPHIYSDILSFLPNFVPLNREFGTLGIHYRRGVGGFSVQIGEKLSREISSDYFVSVARKIIDDPIDNSLRLLIFTDSPSVDFVFKPPASQLDLWKTSQRFIDGEMQVIGLDLEKIFQDVISNVEVVYGGNPLHVIKSLASMEYLVLSRSSFGYVAAILNTEGKIYFPSGFWHIPKKGWKIIQEVNHD